MTKLRRRNRTNPDVIHAEHVITGVHILLEISVNILEYLKRTLSGRCAESTCRLRARARRTLLLVNRQTAHSVVD